MGTHFVVRTVQNGCYKVLPYCLFK